MTIKLSDALNMVCQSDSGLVREHNEDAVTIDPDYGFAILADGMGGYNAGEVASGMTVDILSQGLRQALTHSEPHRVDLESGHPNALAMLDGQIQLANAAVYETAQTQAQCAGMGTTLVAALFYDNRLLVGHIGDSRLYRLRADRFEPLTRDHSLLQEQIDAGLVDPAEARFVDYKNLVTRALGIEPLVEVELNEYPVEIGDLYLMCSDGLNDMMRDGEIADILVSYRSDLRQAAKELIHAANDFGGRDNVSVILIDVRSAFPGGQKWMPRLFNWFGSGRTN